MKAPDQVKRIEKLSGDVQVQLAANSPEVDSFKLICGGDGHTFLRYLLMGSFGRRMFGLPVYDHRRAIVEAFSQAYREAEVRFDQGELPDSHKLGRSWMTAHEATKVVRPLLNSPARAQVVAKIEIDIVRGVERQGTEQPYINLFDTDNAAPGLLLTFVHFGYGKEGYGSLWQAEACGGVVSITDDDHRTVVASPQSVPDQNFTYFLSSKVDRVCTDDLLGDYRDRLEHFVETGQFPDSLQVFHDIVT